MRILVAVALCATVVACAGSHSNLLGTWHHDGPNEKNYALTIDSVRFIDGSHAEFQVGGVPSWSATTYTTLGDGELSFTAGMGGTMNLKVTVLPDGRLSLADANGKTETFVRSAK
jgi:hypothetical protein